MVDSVWAAWVTVRAGDIDEIRKIEPRAIVSKENRFLDDDKCGVGFNYSINDMQYTGFPVVHARIYAMINHLADINDAEAGVRVNWVATGPGYYRTDMPLRRMSRYSMNKKRESDARLPKATRLDLWVPVGIFLVGLGIWVYVRKAYA